MNPSAAATAPPTRPAPRDQQRTAGTALRQTLSRRAQADLDLPEQRDPIAVLRRQNQNRLPELLPVRRERMSESAFAFFRGAAAVMADDLAHQPDTGVRIVICGDAHLSNFGLFASRDRDLVFDVNDFDEAAPGPWEWDLKRLLTSVVIAGQQLGLDADALRDQARGVARSYRSTLAELADTSALGRFYTQIKAAEVLADLDQNIGGSKAGRAAVAQAKKVVTKAAKNTSERALGKLAVQQTDGRWRITEQPPLTARLESLGQDAEQLAREYLHSVPADVAALLAQFTFQDAVIKVVGVGSVGTRCLLALFTDPDGSPLFLQIKQADASVIELATGDQPVLPHGRRVTSGQRILQASGDPFLGDLPDTADGGYYVRQFRDMKGGFEVSDLGTPGRLGAYTGLCAKALARAHAQSGLAATISAYLGASSAVNVADRAFVAFAEAYADVNRADHQLLLAASDADWYTPA